MLISLISVPLLASCVPYMVKLLECSFPKLIYIYIYVLLYPPLFWSSVGSPLRVLLGTVHSFGALSLFSFIPY